jgi:hypothetical protein
VSNSGKLVAIWNFFSETTLIKSIANLRWEGDTIAELVSSFPKEMLDTWLCDAIAK